MEAGGRDRERYSYGSLLKEGTRILQRAEIPEAGLDAWLLLEYAAKISRAWYFAHAQEPVPGEVPAAYLELVNKRADHIPLQHLTHQAFFMGHEFYVDERVLVPRQDTETVVEKALAILDDYGEGFAVTSCPARNGELRIVDLCTGSGCILLSILAETKGISGVGTDISRDALAVAEKNAELLFLRKRTLFLESDLFSSDFFQEKDGKTVEKYDMLISNPPYIPTAQIETLTDEVRLHDPRLALDGQEDGLYFYREISRQAPRLLKPGGWIVFEIGYDQGTAVRRILTECGFSGVSVDRDLAGLDRVVTGRLQYV